MPRKRPVAISRRRQDSWSHNPKGSQHHQLLLLLLSQKKNSLQPLLQFLLTTPLLSQHQLLLIELQSVP